MWRLGWLLWSVGAACSSSRGGSDAGAPDASGDAPDAAVDAAADAEVEIDAAPDAAAACTIELIAAGAGAPPSRLWAPVVHGGEPAALFFDTGSSLTFLYLDEDQPEYVERAGVVDTGCESIEVAGRNIDLGGEIDDLPVVGILGADYLLAGTSVLDLARATLTRHPLGETIAGTEAYAAAPFDDVQGHVLVPVVVDGQDLRLMLDTGSPELLWVGEEGRPGDEEVQTSDAEGTVLTMYLGTALLEMGGEPAIEVPVLRAPEFPYFEETVRILGGDLHGLLGLSSLGARRVIVDPSDRTLRLEPR